MKKEYFTKKELKKLGFKKIGNLCKISRNIFAYNLDAEVGNNVRIDDLVSLKGKIKLKNNIHIAKGSTLSGGEKGIDIESDTSISNFTQIFSESDHYFTINLPSSNFNDLLKKKYSNIISKKIKIGKCVLIGSMTVILPGSNICNFSSTSAHSIVYKKIPQGYFLDRKGKLIKRDINSLKKLYTLYKKII